MWFNNEEKANKNDLINLNDKAKKQIFDLLSIFTENNGKKVISKETELRNNFFSLLFVTAISFGTMLLFKNRVGIMLGFILEFFTVIGFFVQRNKINKSIYNFKQGDEALTFKTLKKWFEQSDLYLKEDFVEKVVKEKIVTKEEVEEIFSKNKNLKEKYEELFFTVCKNIMKKEKENEAIRIEDQRIKENLQSVKIINKIKMKEKV